MFSIGDLVVHPMHGAGMIDDIVQEKIAGVKKEYYVFKMPAGGLVLKIPVATSQMIGLRGIMSREDACALWEAIPNLSVETTANWNKRYRENMLRIKSGDLLEVARVVKSLMVRDSEKGLSTGERKMLRSAKQILISEIVMTTNGDYDDVEQRLNAALAG